MCGTTKANAESLKWILVGIIRGLRDDALFGRRHAVSLSMAKQTREQPEPGSFTSGRAGCYSLVPGHS